MKSIKYKENFLFINHYYIHSNIKIVNIIIDAKEEFHLIDRIIKITLKITKSNSIKKLKSE